MILLPQRLFGLPQVTTLLRDGNRCVLEKYLTESVLAKEGYISNHVISLVLEGTQIIRPYEGANVSIKAGELAFLPRGLYHITDLLTEKRSFRSCLFYFDDALIQTFLTQLNLQYHAETNYPEQWHFGQLPSMRLFVHALRQIYQEQTLQGGKLLEIKLLELLHLLHHLSPQTAFSNFLYHLLLPQKRHIKQFMEHNFDKPLKVEDYAYLTGRSISTFRRDFKAQFKTTPQKWLQEQRIKKALDLLEKEKMTVTHLAFEVGYENVSYFIKAFKRYVGTSPKQYSLAQQRNRVL